MGPLAAVRFVVVPLSILFVVSMAAHAAETWDEDALRQAAKELRKHGVVAPIKQKNIVSGVGKIDKKSISPEMNLDISPIVMVDERQRILRAKSVLASLAKIHPEAFSSIQDMVELDTAFEISVRAARRREYFRGKLLKGYLHAYEVSAFRRINQFSSSLSQRLIHIPRLRSIDEIHSLRGSQFRSDWTKINHADDLTRIRLKITLSLGLNSLDVNSHIIALKGLDAFRGTTIGALAKGKFTGLPGEMFFDTVMEGSPFMPLQSLAENLDFAGITLLNTATKSGLGRWALGTALGVGGQVVADGKVAAPVPTNAQRFDQAAEAGQKTFEKIVQIRLQKFNSGGFSISESKPNQDRADKLKKDRADKLNQDRAGELEKDRADKLNLGRAGKLQWDKEDKLEQGRAGKLEQDRAGKLQWDKEDKVKQDKGDKGDKVKQDKGDKGDKVKQDKGDKVKQDRAGKLQWDKEGKIKQDKEDRVKQEKEDRIKQEKEDRIKQDKEDKVKQDKEDKVKQDKEDSQKNSKDEECKSYCGPPIAKPVNPEDRDDRINIYNSRLAFAIFMADKYPPRDEYESVLKIPVNWEEEKDNFVLLFVNTVPDYFQPKSVNKGGGISENEAVSDPPPPID